MDREEAGALIASHFNRKRGYYHDGAQDFVMSSLQEAQRSYHNEIHIAEMLCLLSHYEDCATRPYIIEHAIFWHDAVYRPQDETGHYRPDRLSVQDSITAFRAYAKDVTMMPDDIESIAVMIEATNGHRAPTDQDKNHYDGFEKDVGLFLDFDLAYFAKPWAKFQQNSEAIRQEYSFVDDERFAAARADVLGKFAERDMIYHSPACLKRWEDQARSNLKRSIHALRNQAIAV